MKFQTWLHNDEDTEVTVEFDLSPEQKQILYPNDDAQPGFPAEIEIYSAIDHVGVDWLDSLSRSEHQQLMDDCWTAVGDYNAAMEAMEGDYYDGKREDMRLEELYDERS